MKIEIKDQNWAFSVRREVLKEYFSFLDENVVCGYCCICGFSLEIGYLYIIEKLRKAGLLPEDHNLLCCRCYRAFIRAKDFGKSYPVYRTLQIKGAKKQWHLAYPNLKIYPRDYS